MRLSKEQLKEIVDKMYHYLAEGSDESDIMDELGLTITEYEKLKRTMFDEKATELRKSPTEHTFVKYIIDQIQNVKDLTWIIENHKDSKNVNACVSAIRVRSEITDKIIARGQEFGILHKEADKKEIKGGFMVAELNSKELKKVITKELSGLNNLIEKYGEDDIIDLEPVETHRGPVNTRLLEPSEEEKKEKAEEKKVEEKKKKTKKIKWKAR
jgi:hypothetical protein